MWYRIDYSIMAIDNPLLDHHERCHEKLFYVKSDSANSFDIRFFGFVADVQYLIL